MRRILFGILVAASLAAADPIVVDVRPSSAPNAFGSPSWGGYVANAMSSLQGNLGNIGARSTDPTAYEIMSPYGLTPGDIMVTSFNSWRGVAGPLAPPFGSELGNRLHFGAHIYATDAATTFTLADVSFFITSPDAALNFFGDLSGTTLNGTTRVGRNWGPDNTPDTGDDVYYQSGQSDATLLHDLWYVGVGNAYWPGGPGDPLTGQAALDATSNYISGYPGFVVFGGYSVRSETGYGAGSASVQATPEPASALLMMGSLFVGAYRAAKKRRLRAAKHEA